MSRLRFTRLVPWALALALCMGIAPMAMPAAGATTDPIAQPTFADPAFQTVWERHDRPVYFGQTSRSYTWGGQVSAGIQENYKEGPNGKHLVQYFDKSRMEINNPSADKNSPFFVTQGLLARDMIRGEVQEGDTVRRPRCRGRQQAAVWRPGRYPGGEPGLRVVPGGARNDRDPGGQTITARGSTARGR
ncbi:MAG: hypothetical protein U0841_05135 [Chloroflexia bacterium]